MTRTPLFVCVLLVSGMLFAAERWPMRFQDAGSLETVRKPVPVALTIDDGCPDGLTVVAPRLERYGWRGCFNIVPESTREKTGSVLGWDDLRELSRRGHEIMIHGTGFADSAEPILPDGSTNAVYAELVRARDKIEKEIGVRPAFVCPHGQRLDMNGIALMEKAGLRAMRGDRPDHGTATIAGTPSGVGAWIDNQLKYDPCSIILMIHAVQKGCGYNPFRSLADFDAYLDEIRDRERKGLIKVVSYAEAEPFDRPAIASTPRWALTYHVGTNGLRTVSSEMVRPSCLTNGPNMWFRWDLPICTGVDKKSFVSVRLNFVATASGGARLWGWIENGVPDVRVLTFEGPFLDEERTRGWTLPARSDGPFPRHFSPDLDSRKRYWEIKPEPVFFVPRNQRD